MPITLDEIKKLTHHALVKKARAGKNVGHGGFKKVEAKAAKEYGSKEAGEKVAAAVMWKKYGKKEETSIEEKAPPGWEGTVKAMKKEKNISNPFALAWSMKKKGFKSHVKEETQLDESSEHIVHYKNLHGHEAFIKTFRNKNRKYITAHLPRPIGPTDYQNGLRPDEMMDARGAPSEHESHTDAEKEMKKHGYHPTGQVTKITRPDYAALTTKVKPVNKRKLK